MDRPMRRTDDNVPSPPDSPSCRLRSPNFERRRPGGGIRHLAYARQEIVIVESCRTRAQIGDVKSDDGFGIPNLTALDHAHRLVQREFDDIQHFVLVEALEAWGEPLGQVDMDHFVRKPWRGKNTCEQLKAFG